MQTLHDRIMSLVKAKQQDDNIVKQNTNGKPNIVSPKKLRMFPNEFGVTLSTALYYQLERFCLANPSALVTKPNEAPQPMSYSKAVRRAVYELMAKPQAMHQAPNKTPAIGLAPERPHNVSWTMPRSKPKDIEYLHSLCSHHGVKNATFVRRAIFLYTRDHVSHNKDDALEAIRDGWA
jgi:hypothetical protein